MRRVLSRGTTFWTAVLTAISSSALGASAADLPVRPGMAPLGQFVPQAQPGLATNPFQGPFFVEPRRFDAYGYPINGPVVTSAPNPLYAATGCAQTLQPVYDVSGNFAGYSPIQACR